MFERISARRAQPQLRITTQHLLTPQIMQQNRICEYRPNSLEKPPNMQWSIDEAMPQTAMRSKYTLYAGGSGSGRIYNQRGTAERHIKEGKQAINWTRLSCKGMAQNEVRLQLHALAYNLGVFLQGTDLPEEMADWSLTSLQTRLIKIGARVVRHAPAITFQLAEFAVSGDLFNRILAAIQRLRAPPVTT